MSLQNLFKKKKKKKKITLLLICMALLYLQKKTSIFTVYKNTQMRKYIGTFFSYLLPCKLVNIVLGYCTVCVR
jgi:membrane glycosyltransferase